MHATLPAAPSAFERSAPIDFPPADPCRGRRRRLFWFLVFSVVYIVFQLIVRQVGQYPLLESDLWWSLNDSNAAFGLIELFTALPFLAGATLIFLVLAPVSAFAHRRCALPLVLAGLIVLEANFFFFSEASPQTLSDWVPFALLIPMHFVCLVVCAALAGPEAKPFVYGFLGGPFRKTLLGRPAYLAADQAFDFEAIAREKPAWQTWEAQRRRTLLFLVFSAIYIATQVVFRWVEYPLFRADAWYYFAREGPFWFETFYRGFLTGLPIVAWGAAVFFLLTRARALTHRRYAFFLLFAGMMFFEADMKWFHMSQKHVSLTEIKVFLGEDHSGALALRDVDYTEVRDLALTHLACFSLCFFLTGPEWLAMFAAIFSGPLRSSLVGRAALWVSEGFAMLGRLCLRPLRWLDSKPAFAVITLLVLVDPVIIWALDQQEKDQEEQRSVIRELAETNPLRLHSLDGAWDAIVYQFSERRQDLDAANVALQAIDLDSVTPTERSDLFLPRPKTPDKPYDVLLIQVESLNNDIFYNSDLPFCKEFAKKCLRLTRHHSVANCTHYGVLGLVRGNPVTYYKGRLPDGEKVPCEYLQAFKKNGYSTRLLSMAIMNHHGLGAYIDDWTEPVFVASNDWSCVYEAHRELAKPGPHYLYTFYNCTHYPYYHEDKYSVHLPEVSYEFNYNRSDLVLFKDQILNRYKNALLEFDDWLKTLLQGVDLSRTIVAITGDHGEEIFQNGHLGHCSSMNLAQTMPPCLVYIPGMPPGEVHFTTSHADILPTVADVLGWKEKPDVLGRSLFEPVPFRYAIVSNFEYKKALRWAVVTEDRKSILERDSDNKLTIVNLVDWHGRKLDYRPHEDLWRNNLRIARTLQAELKRYGH